MSIRTQRMMKSSLSIVLGAAIFATGSVTLVACGDAGTGGVNAPGYGGMIGAPQSSGTQSGSSASGNTSGNGGGGANSGGTGGTQTQAPAAKDYFASTIYPSIKMTCSTCHASGPGPAFFGADAATTYATLDAGGYITANSLLLNKGMHEGPALTAAQRSDMTTWLGYETTERATKPQQPDVLTAVGKCMQQSKFDAIHFEDLVTMPKDNEDPFECTGCNAAPCRTCHSGGEANFFMQKGSAIEDNTFQHTQVAPYIRKFVTLQGSEPVPSNALWNKSIATQSAPAYTHPMFDITEKNAAIVDFVNDAITRYKSGSCP